MNRSRTPRRAGPCHWLASIGLLCCLTLPLAADPCGMVPPIFSGNMVPISRIGLQKTYVFYKDGVETFVIRPGFRGNVDNFGMLIPFPTPPSLRKVPDDIFEQIAKAIDPPEVVIDLTPVERFNMVADAAMPAAGGLTFEASGAVEVLNQEAVGMYDVAVLQAGSAESLKRWMDANGYVYPKGMDAVTNDYVAAGWCFVAVKTRVGNAAAVEPVAGQRNVDPSLPANSVFDGHVQGMGFRFHSDELVVPMRLSAFNEGELRNVVYLLTDGPRRIRHIPEEYVVRQLTGQTLIDNVTKPLPLRIIGGTEKDIPDWQREGLDERRDPTPHNARAKELFAADLLAVSSGNLSLEHEEMEKELLRIGEHFGLRGPEVDADNAAALETMRSKTVDAALNQLADMTMTVVDGDFPRDVLASENLSFEPFEMAQSINAPEFYDATLHGPAGKKPGIRKTSSIEWDQVDRAIVAEHYWSRGLALVLLVTGIGGVFWISRRVGSSALLILVAVTIAWSWAGTAAFGAQRDTRDQMIAKLKDSSSARDAIPQIVEYAKRSEQNRRLVIEDLKQVVRSEESLTQRGWAIAALSAIGGQDVDEFLLDVHEDPYQERIVRTWAAAARVAMPRSVNGLIEKAQLIQKFPALGRPVGLRIVQAMQSEGEQVDASTLVRATLRVPELQTALAPAILAFGPEKLAQLATNADDNDVRRMAAAYLATMANEGESQAVAAQVIAAISFQPQSEHPPWQGGALFLPGISWGKEEAQELVGQLVRWMVWCDTHGDRESVQQIENNLRSIQLANAAGYQIAWDEDGVRSWLLAWGKVVGRDEIRTILAEQKLLDDRRYAGILSDL